jgi:hypothetical protein
MILEQDNAYCFGARKLKDMAIILAFDWKV